MISKIKFKSEYVKNIIILMTGTTIGQVIPIALSPILTRIYSPEDFGVFALYMAIVSILAVMATGRYEMALMLPKKDSDAVNIVVLSMLISCVISLVLFVIVFVFNRQITYLLNNPEISHWLYFIPITVLITGVYQSFNYWSNRKKKFKRLASSRVLQSGSTAFVNLGIGFGGLGSSGLIIGQLLGQSIATFIIGKLILDEDKIKYQHIKVLKILVLAKRYIRFPKYDILASTFNISSHKISHILFNSLFNSTTAGHFFFMQKILSLPIIFLSSAIADVFRQLASDEFNRNKNCKNIFISTLKKLFVLSLFPTIILYFYSVELFIFLFGEEWKVAGEYSKIFSPILMLQFVSSPLSIVFYIAEKQNMNLYLQFLFIVLVLLSMYTAASPETAVISLSLSMGLYYFIQLSFSAYYAGVFKNV
jgi:O-antigen/teichoic acid export membrane protein